MATRSRAHPRNAAATRERILSIAEAAFARRGYEGASLDAIAGEAGVRKATLFYYFESKDRLYGEVARLFAGRFVPLVALFAGEPSLDGLERAVASLHDRLAERPDAAWLLVREALEGRSGEVHAVVGPFLEAAARWVRAGQRRGLFTRELAPRAAVSAIVGAVALPFLDADLFKPDRDAAVTFVRRALAASRRSR